MHRGLSVDDPAAPAFDTDARFAESLTHFGHRTGPVF
jgi:hypothetical protein